MGSYRSPVGTDDEEIDTEIDTPEPVQVQAPSSEPEVARRPLPAHLAAMSPTGDEDFVAREGFDPTMFRGAARRAYAPVIKNIETGRKRTAAVDAFNQGEDQRVAQATAAAQQKQAVKDENAKREAQFRTNRQKTYIDANGMQQPVLDPEGKPLFNKHTGETQYDEKTGEAYRMNTGEHGPLPREDLDANAPIGSHKDAPNRLFKQNKATGWADLGSIDDNLNSNDPRIAAGAAQAKKDRDKFLGKAAVKGFGAAANEVALKHQEQQLAYDQYTAATKTVDDQIATIQASPVYNAREGGLFGMIGTHPTAEAKAMQDQVATLEKSKNDANDPNYLAPVQRPDPRLMKEEIAKSRVAANAFQALVVKHDGDVNEAAREYRAMLKARNIDPETDPALSHLEKTKAEIGMKTFAEEDGDERSQAADAARKDPDLAPHMMEADALAKEKVRLEQKKFTGGDTATEEANLQMQHDKVAHDYDQTRQAKRTKDLDRLREDPDLAPYADRQAEIDQEPDEARRKEASEALQTELGGVVEAKKKRILAEVGPAIKKAREGGGVAGRGPVEVMQALADDPSIPADTKKVALEDVEMDAIMRLRAIHPELDHEAAKRELHNPQHAGLWEWTKNTGKILGKTLVDRVAGIAETGVRFGKRLDVDGVSNLINMVSNDGLKNFQREMSKGIGDWRDSFNKEHPNDPRFESGFINSVLVPGAAELGPNMLGVLTGPFNLPYNAAQLMDEGYRQARTDPRLNEDEKEMAAVAYAALGFIPETIGDYISAGSFSTKMIPKAMRGAVVKRAAGLLEKLGKSTEIYDKLPRSAKNVLAFGVSGGTEMLTEPAQDHILNATIETLATKDIREGFKTLFTATGHDLKTALIAGFSAGGMRTAAMIHQAATNPDPAVVDATLGRVEHLNGAFDAAAVQAMDDRLSPGAQALGGKQVAPQMTDLDEQIAQTRQRIANTNPTDSIGLNQHKQQLTSLLGERFALVQDAVHGAALTKASDEIDAFTSHPSFTNRSPEEIRATQDMARGVVKLASGVPMAQLPIRERAFLEGPGSDGLPRVQVVDGQPVISDGLRDRLKAVAPTAAAMVQKSETEQLAANTAVKEKAKAAGKKPKEPAKQPAPAAPASPGAARTKLLAKHLSDSTGIPQAEAEAYAEDYLLGEGIGGHVAQRADIVARHQAGKPASELTEINARLAKEVTQEDQEKVEERGRTVSPELVDKWTARLAKLIKQPVTPEMRKAVEASAGLIGEAVTKHEGVFDEIDFVVNGPKEWGGVYSPGAKKMNVVLADLLDEENFKDFVRSPKLAEARVQEEAIHALIQMFVTDEEVEAIWNELPEKIKDLVRETYLDEHKTHPDRDNARELGHEYFRMIVQGKLGSELTEGASTKLMKLLKKALRSLLTHLKYLREDLIDGGMSQESVDFIDMVTEMAAGAYREKVVNKPAAKPAPAAALGARASSGQRERLSKGFGSLGSVLGKEPAAAEEVDPYEEYARRYNEQNREDMPEEDLPLVGLGSRASKQALEHDEQIQNFGGERELPDNGNGYRTVRTGGVARRKYLPQVWRMFEQAYRKIGNQYQNAAQLYKEKVLFDVVYDAHGEAVAFNVHKVTPWGRKSIATGGNGTQAGKAAWIANLGRLREPGNYSEMSDAARHLAQKEGVPVVPFEDAEKVLEGKVLTDKANVHFPGEYERDLTINGVTEPHIKRMFGLPFLWKKTQSAPSTERSSAALRLPSPTPLLPPISGKSTEKSLEGSAADTQSTSTPRSEPSTKSPSDSPKKAGESAQPGKQQQQRSPLSSPAPLGSRASRTAEEAGEEEEQGAPINYEFKEGGTPAERVHKNIGMVETLANQWASMPGADLDDIRQRARVALFRAAKQHDPSKGDFGAYARTVVRNDLRDMFRKEAKYRAREKQTLNAPMGEDAEDEQIAGVRDEGASVTRDVANREGAEILQKAIDELPKNLRVVIRGLIDGDTLEVIGEREGIKRAGVSNRAQIAYTRLRQKLTEMGLNKTTDLIGLGSRASRITPTADTRILQASNATVVGPALHTLGSRTSKVGTRARPLTAYHGTPHEVDRFSMTKIDSGEGAQVYGHGLYFSQLPVVAKYYRDSLTKGDNKGSLYTVSLDVDEDEMLDWDKPMGEQTPKVREALNRLAEQTGAPIDLAEHPAQLYHSKSSKWEDMDKVHGGLTRQQISETLLALGVPGIRYHDERSRGTAADRLRDAENHRKVWREVLEKNPSEFNRGVWQKADTVVKEIEQQKESDPKTSNYVVFDDSLIEITKRNDQALGARSSKVAAKDEEKKVKLPPAKTPAEARERAITKAENLIEYSKKYKEAIPLVHAKDENGKLKVKIVKSKGPGGGVKYISDPIYEQHPYQLRAAPGLPEVDEVEEEDGSKTDRNDDKAVKKLADLIGKEFENRWMKEPAVMAGKGWYAKMRKYFQRQLGAGMEMFGQLLGATSARTPVPDNFKQSIEAIRNYSRGDYDGLLRRYHEHVMAVKKKADDGVYFRQWKAEHPNSKDTTFDLDEVYRKEINSFEEQPLKSNGKPFNMNSDKVLQSLYGNWLEQTVGPKTPNFAGNLTGRTTEATIDVWAARFLRRILYEKKLKQWRLLPKQEGGVDFTRSKAGKYGGDFFFAQRAIALAGERFGIAPDDMQAILWFAEKQVWEERGYDGEAEKYSFENEANQLEGGRFQAGATSFVDQESFDPAIFEQEREALLKKVGATEGLIAARVNSSQGLYTYTTEEGEIVEDQEPSFDVEFTYGPNADILPVVEHIIDLGRRHNQKDVFVSQVVDKTHPNARPGIEIGFKSPTTTEEVNELARQLRAQGIDGFTIARDSQGRALGIRAQYIPEITTRFDQSIDHLDPAQAEDFADGWTKKARTAMAQIMGDNVSYKTETWFSTNVYGKEEYTTANPERPSEGRLEEQLGRRRAALGRGQGAEGVRVDGTGTEDGSGGDRGAGPRGLSPPGAAVESALGSRASKGSSPSSPGGFNPYAAIAELQRLAAGEQPGQRTYGRPDLALGAAHPGIQAVDEWRKDITKPQHVQDWQAAAVAMLKQDRAGLRAKIIARGMSGGTLTPEETMAAKMLVADEMKRAFSTGGKKARDDVAFLFNAYRETGSTAARELRARFDPNMTPEQRSREFLGRIIFTPPPDVRKKLDAAATPEERKQILEKDQARVMKIERELEKMGVTLEDILKGEVTLRVKGAKWVENTTQGLAAKEKEAVRMIQANRPWKDIAAHTGLTEAQIKAVEAKMWDSFLKSHLGKFKGGATVDSVEFAAGPLGSRGTGPVTDEEAMQEAEKAFRALGFGRGDAQGNQPFNLAEPAQVARVARTIQAIESGPTDMLMEAWINGILSGPQTQVGNVAGNAANAAWDFTVQRGLEALLNATIVHDPNSAQLGELPEIARGIIPGIARGLRLAAKSFSAEMDFFRHDVLGEPIELTQNDKGGGPRTAIPGKTGRVVRLPGRALMFADAFFKGLIGQMEAGAQAYRIAKAEGLKGDAATKRINQLVSTPGSEAWIRAVDKSTELTFQQPIKSAREGGNPVESLVSKVEDMRNNSKLVALLVPFVRTPYNIFRMGLRKSPLGAANLMSRIASAGFYKIKDGKPIGESYLPPEAVKHMAEQLLAWTATALLYAAVQGDDDDEDKPLLITGSLPGTEVKRGERELEQRTHGGDYVVRIGGKTFHYGRYEPFATVLGTTVDAIRQIKKSGTPAADKLDGMFSYFLAQAQSKTFVQGLADFIGALQDPENKLGQVRNRFLSTLVPNIIRQPLRNVDDYVRDSRGGGVPYQMLPAESMAEPKIDVWGRKTEKGGTSVSRLAFASPVKPYAKPEGADLLLLNWNRENPSERWSPTPVTREVKIDGKTVKLSPDQFRAYSEAAGAKVAAMLKDRLSPAQIKNPTEEDLKMVKAAFDKGRAEARDAVKRKAATTANTAREAMKLQ